MTFQELVILLPCHSLEDFPLHHEGDEATGLLAGWTALWHPVLVDAAGSWPTWARADDPPEELEGRLLVIPQVSESLLLAGWSQRAKNEGACVLRRKLDRQEIVDAALAELDGEPPRVDPDLVADFFALGYAYLQEELLTRQMRYISNLDETHFANETVAAARAAVAGDEDKARQHLQNGFDVLAESREHVYPAEAYLVDLTLVAPTTIGGSLRQELASGFPTSLIISGEALAAMADKEPQTLAAVRAALDEDKASLAGGEFAEEELPLLPIETVLDNFKKAGRAYVEHLGQAPAIYARRRYGLSPLLPQVLARCEFDGALHFTLDDGQFPRDEQSRATWEGWDASTIDMLTRVPLDIDRPESFLNLCQKIGEAMDYDHVATVTFAHWPGKSSEWYDDLRRMSRYAPVLGKFVTLKEYFDSTASAGNVTRFMPDQYRAPYLRQAIIRRQENAISRLAELHRSREATAGEQTLSTFTGLLGGQATDEDTAGAFAKALPREEGGSQKGCLVVNPQSTTRRALVDVSHLPTLPDVAGPVKAVQGGERKLAVVDVPGMGYTWLTAGRGGAPKSKEPPLADPQDLMLRNEFFELLVDEHTGAVRALYDYQQRRARLSQQIARRQPGPRGRPGEVWRDPDETAVYSVMAADSVEVTSTGPALGEIVSRGRLVDKEGQRLARFKQTVQVWRGSRVILLEIELDVEQKLRADPWNSYYAARFAWANEAVDLYRGVSLTRQRTELKRLESPYFVEACDVKTRTAILTGGLPYHRRVGMRMLDTLLVVRGEKQRRFRLGIAIDHPQPMAAALDVMCPMVSVDDAAPPPRAGTSSCLFDLSAKNVLATHWEPIADESGSVAGFRVRLLESEGRPVKARLKCLRRPASARQVNFRGETLAELTVEEDAVVIDFTAYEWNEVEVRW